MSGDSDSASTLSSSPLAKLLSIAAITSSIAFNLADSSVISPATLNASFSNPESSPRASSSIIGSLSSAGTFAPIARDFTLPTTCSLHANNSSLFINLPSFIILTDEL